MKNHKSSFLYIVVFLALIMACEDVDLKGVEAGNVQGLWQLNNNSGDNTFLLVSDTEFNFYKYNSRQHCISIDAFIVVNIEDAGFYTVKKNLEDEENEVFALSKNRSRVHVRNIEKTQDEIEIYWPSEVDIENYAPECFNDEVFGTWRLETEEVEEYLMILDHEISSATFDTTNSCFNFVDFEIVEVVNNTFYLQEQIDNPDQFKMSFSILDNKMEATWDYGGDLATEYFIKTDSEISVLEPFCTTENSETVTK